VEYEKAKDQYDIISTIPTENGWDVQIVSDKTPVYESLAITPGIEHAYVYYMEHRLQTHLSE
jgi:hypothetical protein